jgi:hypothetical protein
MNNEHEPTPLRVLVGYEFQQVDPADLPLATLLDQAAEDGDFKRLGKINDNDLRSLTLRYGHLAQEFKWAKAMMREESERKERRASRERWLFLVLSFLFGGAGGIVAKWLFGL